MPNEDTLDTNCLKNITLDEQTIARCTGTIEQERTVAIFDILAQNSFAPVAEFHGPFHLHLSISEQRLLVWDIRDETDTNLISHIISLQPFRAMIKDYFDICESYYDAIKIATPSKIETIDMARRGLHDDAAVFLSERLEGKIAFDHPTARRLFTLMCVLCVRR